MWVVLSRFKSIICNSTTLRRIAIVFCVAVYTSIVLFALFNGCSRCQYTEPRLLTQSYSFLKSGQWPCRPNIDKLGIVQIDISDKSSMRSIEMQNRDVELGGKWRPKHCQPLQTIAIIIPYRDRYRHLRLLLKRLHPMLQMQHLQYHIFVIEQSGSDHFNRGKLMNVGFKEALKVRPFDCFVFHDVDMVPENDKNIYMCDGHARHLASAIDDMRYHVKYYNYAGGVIAINRTNVEKINGYSNLYWGWGNEDDDLSARTQASGMMLTRPPEYIGRYKMAFHKPAAHSGKGNWQFFGWRGRWRWDGLNDTRGMNYTVLTHTHYPLYTYILADLGSSRTNSIDPSKDTTHESIWWFLKFYYP